MYKEAKSINNEITLNDVKEYFSKLQSKQVQFKYRGYNSCVSKYFLEHIQLDIADVSKNVEQNEGFRYALAGLDVLSRYGWLVPMKTKQPHDVIHAFEETMRVISIPKTILSDMDGVSFYCRIY